MMDHGKPLSPPDASQDSLALQPIGSAPSPSPSPSPSRAQQQPPTPRSSRRRPTLDDRRQPSIRIRRPGSASTLNAAAQPSAADRAHDFAYDPPRPDADTSASNRRRSSSEPQRPPWAMAADARNGRMPRLDEETGRPSTTQPPIYDDDFPRPATPTRPGMLRRASVAALSAMKFPHHDRPNDRQSDRQSDVSAAAAAAPKRRQRRDTSANEYDSNLVDLLDVVDPEIATLSTLTNVQNSLFVPDLGGWLNRRPTYTLTRDQTFWRDNARERAGTGVGAGKPPSVLENPRPARLEDGDGVNLRPGMDRTFTIRSNVSDTSDHYAVLPHGISLQAWSTAEKEELNDHVRHMLHSKRAAFKRSMKGFGQYVRRPLGFFVTVYATLITLFGLAWVLFLIGWINVGGRQSYIINIIDNIMVALFALVGDGLIPFRIIDTYHMIYIAHYHHLTWRLRKKKNMPKLKNENDLPVLPGIDADIEADAATDKKSFQEEEEEESVLTPEQQRKLKHHEDKFSRSHTFYKPHETETHRAFPLRILVAVVVLLDFHSVFQVALGTCTWAISYHVRPFALTTVILCFSITCNITGGVLISIGDKMSRKKDVVERMFRQQLTEQAINKIERRRLRELNRNEELEAVVTPET